MAQSIKVFCSPPSFTGYVGSPASDFEIIIPIGYYINDDGTATTFTENLDSFIGEQATNTGYYGYGGVFNNNGEAAVLNAYSATAVVGCAVDLDTGKVWFRDSTGSFGAGNPAAGTGAHVTLTPGLTLFAGFTCFASNDATTANFGGSAFAYSIPSGFSAWG